MALAILSTTFPNGTLNTPYNQVLQASGGTPPYTWSITSGALPTGLSITTTGGTPGGNFGATIYMSGTGPSTNYPNWQTAVGRTITSTKCYPGSQGGAGGGSSWSDGTGSTKWFPTSLNNVVSGLQDYVIANNITVYACYKPYFSSIKTADYNALQASLSAISGAGVKLKCILWQEVENSLVAAGGTPSQYWQMLNPTTGYGGAVRAALGPGNLLHDASANGHNKWSAYFPGVPNVPANLVDGAGVDMYSTSYNNGVRLDPEVALCKAAGIPFAGVFEMGVSISTQQVPPAGQTEASFITDFYNYMTHIQTVISANQPSTCMWYQAQGGNLHNLIPGFASGGSLSGVTGPNAIPYLQQISDICEQTVGSTTAITGIPPVAGTYSFTLKVTDSLSATASVATSITIPSAITSIPVVPVPPSFAYQDSSLANLQALSSCVSFISDNDVKPTWHFYKTGVQALGANTWSTLIFGTSAFDSSNVSDGTGAQITTQGYYAVEACVPFQAGAGGIAAWVAFLVTAGPNSTHTAGTTLQFGLRGGSATAVAGDDFTLNTTDIVPWCLYPGDTVYVQAYVTSAISTNKNQNSSYTGGRFVPNFTGMWIRSGP
jgi:hypothetical protein